jgi:hypothetical protein
MPMVAAVVCRSVVSQAVSIGFSAIGISNALSKAPESPEPASV